jgi:hypothetical protein
MEETICLNIRDEQVRGSCTVSANDVLFTCVNGIAAAFPGFLGVRCFFANS